tara:strand:+ start:111 stop:365 length:255 start_codon:yes stop_codon:yes gene_type:complete
MIEIVNNGEGNIMRIITTDERAEHKERGTFYIFMDGTPGILEWDDAHGTCLVPVRVMEPVRSCCPDGTFGLSCKCDNNNSETGV